jgi:hypothetical protein
MKQTKIDIIFSKLSRDLGITINEEEIIEWTGDALGLLRVSPMLSERVCFGQVKNFKMCLPSNFLYLRMIARHRHCHHFDYWWRNTLTIECNDSGDEGTVSWSTYLYPDHGYDITAAELADGVFPYGSFISSSCFRNNWTPIRLSEHVFFNGLHYPRHYHEPELEGLYGSNIDEYKIVGDENRVLQFNFERGIVAIAYLAVAIDEGTGYPLIPDDERTIEAICYYIKWKIAQRNLFSGSYSEFKFNQAKSQEMERLWIQYSRAAKNNAVMPKTLDEYQNRMDNWLNIIPNYYKYYSYFGRHINGRK